MTTAFRPLSGALLRSRLTEIVHRVLSDRDGAALVSREQCATLSFAALGMDSLAGAELTVELEEELGIELSPSDVYAYPDVDTLARFIEQRVGARRAPEYSPPTRGSSGRLASMLQDAVLAPDIQPHGKSTATAILVTGATGFLGAHLVHALLEGSEAGVYCLVRVDGGGLRHARERVLATLRRYVSWNDTLESRLEVIGGDLTRPSLGLDDDAFKALASSIGEIFHAAADVDWIQPYEGLRDANVIGTRELLRLACTGLAKRFHFVSSLGVCYNSDWSEPAKESDAPLDGLASIHLGYAQSKAVAEALVREAGARGLPITIIRPALISGDSRSGVSNEDDLVSRFIRGCIRMGVAPDLDWVMDSVPADYVAQAIVSLASREEHSDGAAYHVANPVARHWRECVLWMRLRGYAMELLSYREWTERLRMEATSPDHPLYALRAFFLGSVSGMGGLALPELYEDSRRRPVSCAASDEALLGAGLKCPPLDASLLDRYFASYIERGSLHDPCHAERSEAKSLPLASLRVTGTSEAKGLPLAEFTPSAVEGLRVTALRVTGKMGGDSSIVAELTSWRRGTAAGLYSGYLSKGGRDVEVVIKVKPLDRDVLEIGSHVAHLCGRALGDAYDRLRDHTGFTRGHVRELAVYESAPEDARQHMPALHAAVHDADRQQWLLAVERVTGAEVIDAWNRAWSPEEIDAALRGMTGLHAAWRANASSWSQATWLPPARTPDVMTCMEPLWSALADNARPIFDRWTGPELSVVHRRLASSTAEWFPASMSQPRTLVHNDFNSRNILLKRVGGALHLYAFDWELATEGAPQRDLAELLCFVLDPAHAQDQAGHWITRGRQLFEAANSIAIDPNSWRAGFRAALNELLVDRLAMYAMLQRIRPQPFLPRVVQTWLAIHHHLEARR